MKEKTKNILKFILGILDAILHRFILTEKKPEDTQYHHEP
jgi:hypothetical protein